MTVFWFGSIGFVPFLLAVLVFVWLNKRGFFDPDSTEAEED